MKKKIVITIFVLLVTISNFCFSPKMNPCEKSEITLEITKVIADETGEDNSPFTESDSVPYKIVSSKWSLSSLIDTIF